MEVFRGCQEGAVAKMKVPLASEKVERIKELALAGKGPREIGKDIGHHEATVSRYLRRLGLAKDRSVRISRPSPLVRNDGTGVTLTPRAMALWIAAAEGDLVAVARECLVLHEERKSRAR